MADKPLISADSHFVEPPKMWAERLMLRFPRSRAPHAVRLEGAGKPGEYLACEDIAPAPHRRFFSGVPRGRDG